MFVDRLYYDIRVSGRWMVAVPLFTIAGSFILVMLLKLSQTKTIGLFTACLEMFLPFIAGIFIVRLCGHDAAAELLLSMPVPYRRTVFRRSLLIGSWIALVALLISIPLSRLHFIKIFPFENSWPDLMQWLLVQLTWLAPLLWFMGLGLFLVLLLRSRAASTALLGGVWVGENIMYGLLIGTPWLHPIFLFATSLTPLLALSSFWLSNRIQLLVTGLVLLIIAWLQLHNTEVLLQKTLKEE